MGAERSGFDGSAAAAGSRGLAYAQCWEDADILIRGLDVRPGDACLSIASGGDNTLALLACDPESVVALDSNPAQIACLGLRVAAFRSLEHAEILEFVGSLPSRRRADLYRRCRPALSAGAREFWDARGADIERGVGGAGRFERYLEIFRTRVLPRVHPAERVERLCRQRSPQEREAFYQQAWDTWRWRAAFRFFFSRPVMGLLGRRRRFFRYVEGDVAGRILARARAALTRQDPSRNPYLHWILTGRHGEALPFALRPENFEAIRTRLDRLRWECRSVQDFLAATANGGFQRYNLSDIFEYLSPGECRDVLERIARRGRRGGRLVYWNMLVERHRPEDLAARLRPLDGLAAALHAEDRIFFYQAVVVEEIA